MMGERTVAQEALFYSFSLERHVPVDHMLRSIDRFVDLSGIRDHLKPFYSEMGRPSGALVHYDGSMGAGVRNDHRPGLHPQRHQISARTTRSALVDGSPGPKPTAHVRRRSRRSPVTARTLPVMA